MKRISLIVVIVILAFSVSSCLEPNYVFSKKDWYAYDLYEYSNGLCDIINANGGMYYSLQDTFRYFIVIHDKEPNVTFVLNSLQFTDKENKTIPIKYYVRTVTDTLGKAVPSVKKFVHKEFDVDTLPFVLPDSGLYNIHSTTIEILAETHAQIKDLQVVKVEYDFQVGDQQYVRDNIIYKRRFKIKIEGHEWNPSFLR